MSEETASRIAEALEEIVLAMQERNRLHKEINKISHDSSGAALAHMEWQRKTVEGIKEENV